MSFAFVTYVCAWADRASGELAEVEGIVESIVESIAFAPVRRRRSR